MTTNRALLCLAFTVLAVALPACDLEIAPGRTDHAIIGGDMVEGDDFGSVIGVMTNAGSICTGTLISPTVVLTAAHCVEPEMLKASIQASGGTPPDEITYQVSFSRDLHGLEAGDMIDAESVEWHAEFLSDLNVIFTPGVTQWNDIALVYLSEPVEGHPIQKLAPTDVVETVDGMLAVAGYGMTDDSDPMSAGLLHSGQSGMDELGTFEILAGEGDPQQACRGDSGGPIFADDSDTYQIGIASRLNAALGDLSGQPPPCNTGLLYTRVDAYQEWIAERTADLPDDGDDGDDDDSDDDEEDDGDGGGCSMAGGASGPGAGLVLLLALAVASRRRRRA
jgi:MYXO-CTERM domain-containing protein